MGGTVSCVSWPGGDLRLTHSLQVLSPPPAHLSLFTVLYRAGKLNFSLLTFILESSYTILAGNSDIQKLNLFQVAQRVKEKDELFT